MPHETPSPMHAPRSARSRWTRLWLAAALSLVLPSPAAAQGRVRAFGGYGWNSTLQVQSGAGTCGQSNLLPGSSAFGMCHGGPNFMGASGPSGPLSGAYDGDFIVSGSTSAVAGTLKGTSSVSYYINKTDSDPSAPFPISGGNFSTLAVWTDQALLTALGPAAPPALLMDITYRLTGAMSGTVDLGYAMTDPSTGVPIGTGYIGNATLTALFTGSGAAGGAGGFYDPGFANIGSSTAADPIGGLYTLRVPFAGLTSDVFTVSLGTSVNLNIFGVPQGVYVGSVTSDFSNTALPLSYVLYDAGGNDVTSLYQVSFAQGLQVAAAPPPPTAVPEPATLALVGVGLAALAARRLRGRRR